MYHENTSTVASGIFHWNTTGERCITIVFHAIEKNTMVKTINATCARYMMGMLGVIPSNIQRLSRILIGLSWVSHSTLVYTSLRS